MADTVFVVDNGLAIVTDLMTGGGTEPKNIHWGIGTTVPTSTWDALETARGEAKTIGTSSRVTTNVSNDTYQVTGSITCAGSSAAITEAGLFDSSTTLFLRATFSAINLNVGDSINFTIKSAFDQA